MSVSLYLELNYSNNLSLNHNFSLLPFLNLNLSRCAECPFTFSRSANLDVSSFSYAEPIAKVDSLKYLGITIDTHLQLYKKPGKL